MKKMLSFIVMLVILAAVALTGCTSTDQASMQQQLDTYKEENERLRKENTELKSFKERVEFSLFKLESTIYTLDSEGFLPLAGSQVNAPQLYEALEAIKDMDIQLEDREIVLSMMPQEWSGDFNTILIVYDVYKPVLNGTDTDSGKASTMAGIFRKINDKWELMEFTREFKGDESFSLKNK